MNSTYMSESFPASVRGTAVGTAYNVGRIGSTLSTAAHRHGRDQLLDRSRHRPARLRLRDLRDRSGAVRQGEMFDPKAIEAEDVPARAPHADAAYPAMATATPSRDL